MKLPHENDKTIEFSKQERTYLQKAEAIARRAARYSLDDDDVKDAAENASIGLSQLLQLTVAQKAR